MTTDKKAEIGIFLPNLLSNLLKIKNHPFKSTFEAEKAKCHLRFLYKNFLHQNAKKPRNIVFVIGNIHSKPIERTKAMQFHSLHGFCFRMHTNTTHGCKFDSCHQLQIKLLDSKHRGVFLFYNTGVALPRRMCYT